MMKEQPEQLYLDLIKKTLSFNLWPHPPVPIDTFNDKRSPFKRLLVSFISKILQANRMQLVKEQVYTEKQREEGHFRARYSDTMIGLKRLDNLRFCVETAIREGIEGDLIETGVWRGGASIFMRAILAAHGVTDRKVYVADSFQGLPKPEPDKYPADKDGRYHLLDYLAVSQDEVENNFKKFNLLDDQVIFLKGWFKDTLPDAPMEKLAVLRFDGDMYGSTMDALTNLYPKLSKGGFCIIDDYGLAECKSAVDDFRAENQIKSEIKIVDWTGVYWRKE